MLKGQWMQKSLRLLYHFFLVLGCLSFAPASFAAKAELSLIGGVKNPYPAPLLIGISSWLNSEPIKLSDLQGKVVLIEFWTASCPYCRNALPYINKWYNRYHNKGLVIIGIHSPKNVEEQSRAQVKDAIATYDIHYPVALDNNFETWENYNAEGWPSFYLINREGKVVFASFGAENYEIIENNIRFLLNLNEDGSKPAAEALGK